MDRFAAIDTFVRVAESRSFAEAARQMRVAQLGRHQRASSSSRTSSARRCSTAARAWSGSATWARPSCATAPSWSGRANDIVDQMRDVTARRRARCACMRCRASCWATSPRCCASSRPATRDIHLELIVSDAVIDPVKAGVDCALQIFPPRSEELVSRPLFPVRRVFCATPDYLRAPRHAAQARATCTATARPVLGLPDARPLDLPPPGRADHALPERRAADQQRAPAARVRAGARGHRLPADAGGGRRDRCAASCRWCCPNTSCRRSRSARFYAGTVAQCAQAASCSSSTLAHALHARAAVGRGADRARPDPGELIESAVSG